MAHYYIPNTLSEFNFKLKKNAFSSFCYSKLETYLLSSCPYWANRPVLVSWKFRRPSRSADEHLGIFKK